MNDENCSTLVVHERTRLRENQRRINLLQKLEDEKKESEKRQEEILKLVDHFNDYDPATTFDSDVNDAIVALREGVKAMQDREDLKKWKVYYQEAHQWLKERGYWYPSTIEDSPTVLDMINSRMDSRAVLQCHLEAALKHLGVSEEQLLAIRNGDLTDFFETYPKHAIRKITTFREAVGSWICERREHDRQNKACMCDEGEADEEAHQITTKNLENMRNSLENYRKTISEIREKLATALKRELNEERIEPISTNLMITLLIEKLEKVTKERNETLSRLETREDKKDDSAQGGELEITKSALNDLRSAMGATQCTINSILGVSEETSWADIIKLIDKNVNKTQEKKEQTNEKEESDLYTATYYKFDGKYEDKETGTIFHYHLDRNEPVGVDVPYENDIITIVINGGALTRFAESVILTKAIDLHEQLRSKVATLLHISDKSDWTEICSTMVTITEQVKKLEEEKERREKFIAETLLTRNQLVKEYDRSVERTQKLERVNNELKEQIKTLQGDYNHPKPAEVAAYLKEVMPAYRGASRLHEIDRQIKLIYNHLEAMVIRVEKLEKQPIAKVPSFENDLEGEEAILQRLKDFVTTMCSEISPIAENRLRADIHRLEQAISNPKQTNECCGKTLPAGIAFCPTCGQSKDY